MPTTHLELIGRPDIKWDFNGLREITRYYTVHGSAGDTDANIQANVFASFGTADTEGVFPNALLVAQQLQRTNGNMAVDATLVRVFKDFVDNQKTPVGEDVLTKLESGQTALIRKYVCLASDAASLTPEVGTVVDGRALQTATIQNAGVGAVITETYISSGLLSEAIEYSNNGKLEIRTLTYFNEVPPSPGTDWVLVSKNEQNQGGIPTRSYRFAKGTGVVGYSYENRSNGVLELANVSVLTGIGAEAQQDASDLARTSGLPSEEDAVFTNYQRREDSGHIVWTLSFARGNGLLSRDTEVKFAGTLTVTTESYLTGVGVAPGPITGEFSREKREQDGYLLWTLRGAVGSGIVEDNTQTRFNGKLTLRTLVYLVSGPAGTPPPEAHVTGETTFRADERDGYVLYTSIGTYVTPGSAGSVVDSDNSIILTSGINGETTHVRRHVYTTLNSGPSSYVGYIVDQRTSSEEGYTVYTTTTIEVVNADLPDEQQERFDGKIRIVTRRRVNSTPLAPLAPYADPVLVRTDVQTQSGFSIYVSTYVVQTEGLGAQIAYTESDELDGRVKRRTYSTIDAPPSDGDYAGEIIDTSSNAEEGFTLFRTTTIEVVNADLPDEVVERHNGALTLTTKRKINSTPTGTGPTIRTDVQQGQGYTIYSKTFVTGSGNIGESSGDVITGHVVRHVYTSVGVLPTGMVGATVSTETQEADGYTLYTVTTVQVTNADLPDEVVERHNGALTLTTKRKINSTPTGTGPTIRTDVQQGQGYTIYSKTFVTGSGNIGESSGDVITGHVVRHVYTSVGVLPTGMVGATVSTETQEADGYTLYTVTTVQVTNADLPDEVVERHNGALTLTTKRKINSTPTGTGPTIRTDVQQGQGYTIYSKTFVTGSGNIGESSGDVITGHVVRHVYTSIGALPTGMLGSAVSTETQEADGYTLYTVTTIQVTDADLPDEVVQRHNGTLILTTYRKINSVPAGTGPVIRTDVQQGQGYTIYSKTCVTGSGNIGETEADVLTDHVVRHVYTSVGVLPTGMDGAVVSTETQEADGYTLYTVTTIEVTNPDLPEEVVERYNGNLTLTTYRKINDTPTGTGIVIRSDVQQGQGYTIFSKTYVTGEGTIGSTESDILSGHVVRRIYTSVNEMPSGMIGETVSVETQEADGYTLYTVTTIQVTDADLPDEVVQRHNGTLILTTYRKINSVPAGTGPVIRTDVQQGQGYTIYSKTCVTGSGNIGETEADVLTDHVVRHVYTSVGVLPTGMDGAVVSTETQEADGYTLYTVTTIEVTNPDLPEEVVERYNGNLTLTTYRKINDTPTGTGIVIRSDVQQGQGYTIFSKTYVTGEGTIGSTESDILSGHVVRRIYTSVNEMPSGMIGETVSVETQEADGYTLYTVTTIQVTDADLPDEVVQRHNGTLILTTYRKINSVPAGTGPVIRTDVQQGQGYTIYSKTCVTGSGNIGETEADVLTDHVVRHVYTSVGVLPTGMDGAVVSTETQEADGYTLYTVTTIEVTNPDLPEEVVTRHNGNLTLTTKRRINSPPSGTGQIVQTNVQQAQGYTIYSNTYASGQGVIDEDTNFSLGGQLITYTARAINAAPTAPTGDYVTLISSDIQQSDGYTVQTKRWVYGKGLIDTDTENRTDGSVVVTKTFLNEVTDVSTPQDFYLANEDTEPGQGYQVITRQFYKPPQDYTVQGIRVVTKPGTIKATDDGPLIERIPSVVSVTTSIEVKFVVGPTLPSPTQVTPLSGGCTAFERIEYEDNTKSRQTLTYGQEYCVGTTPELLFTNSVYREKPTNSGSLTISGSPDPVLNQTLLTFSWDLSPYFRSGSLAVYKHTVETGTLS